MASRLAYHVLDNPAAAIMPGWTIREKYYWLERFPAHQTVVPKNEYKPFPGWLTLYVGKNSLLVLTTIRGADFPLLSARILASALESSRNS